MIRPPGFRGAAFAAARHRDARRDRSARHRLADELGIAQEWAYVSQVHGAKVVHATEPGSHGEADALYVDAVGLPITVATADCVPVVIEADDAVAAVHAGWRGAMAGVVEEALEALRWSGHEPRRAAIGPSIGPCCYEVGDDVAVRFGRFVGTTTWGAISVDIAGYLANRLAGLEVWRSDVCTFTADDFNSHRLDGTRERQMAVAWLPQD